MKLEFLLAATIWLAVPLSQPLTAQDKAAATSRASALAALRDVQQALHAAETAQVRLLAEGRDARALAEVNRAVKSLAAAREFLRVRLAVKGQAPAPLPAPPKLNLPRPDSNKVKLAIEKGLRWLHAHQDQDGKWDSDGFMKHDVDGQVSDGPGNPVHDVGTTGLALLTFLGAGNTTKSGPHKEVVNKAVSWLKKQQGRNGLFGTAASHDFIYDHAIATFAMCEALVLSTDKRLQQSAQKGIDYLESHRNPYGCWRYQPRDNDNDISVTRWCVMAYKSAEDCKLQVNKQALKIAANFVDELTDPVSGKCGYTRKGQSSSRHPGDHSRRFPVEKGDALTAVGLTTRFVLGQRPVRTRVMTVGADRLLRRLPKAKDRGSIDHYYWFHGTSAMQQMGGNYWDQWSRAAAEAMLSTQRNGGSVNGSWDSNGVWGEDGGRIYSTSLLLMALQVVASDLKIRKNR